MWVRALLPRHGQELDTRITLLHRHLDDLAPFGVQRHLALSVITLGAPTSISLEESYWRNGS
jgi:hypothetical protein